LAGDSAGELFLRDCHVPTGAGLQTFAWSLLCYIVASANNRTI